jgi:hypothetical protein
MAVRGHVPESCQSVDSGVTFDLPGMIWTQRQKMTVRVDGLSLFVPCHDWGVILARLRKSESRIFASGETYYKLHGYCRCVVMTPEQRESFLRALEAGYDEAYEKAESDIGKMTEIRQRLVDDGVLVSPQRVVVWTGNGEKNN